LDLSVLIPTRGRPHKLRACCLALSRQTLDPTRFEVLVGVDGDATDERALARSVLPGVRVFQLDHAGPASTRNHLLDQARGRVVLLLNDDVAPEAGCVEAHARSHEELDALGIRAMVLGDAPFAVPEHDTLFDRLIRETSMVFFYDRMTGEHTADPMHDWGFRHAWTLNLSVARNESASVGDFDETLACACYEDLEWAWRLSRRRGLGVVFRPRARVVHDHRYTPHGYLEREGVLGREAYRLAESAPQCAREIFGRDIADPEHIECVRAAVELDGPLIDRLAPSFEALAEIASDAIAGPHADRLVALLYEHHLPIKRWHWRRGLLGAAGLGPPHC